MLPDPEKFKDVDFIIHAGDIGPDYHPARPKKEIIRWYENELFHWALDIGKPIYMTYGNHDFIGERIPERVKESLAPNMKIYIDEQVDIEGKKVWFSPWSNLFGDWAFMRTEQGLEALYAAIPNDTQVIISHGPPYGYGDYVPDQGINVGSASLILAARNLPQMELIVCGHIHEGRGIYKDGKVDIINASLVDEHYNMIHEPVIIDWD